MQGQGPGPRYGHVMDLVAQRYLVTVSGNDGMNISLSSFNFVKSDLNALKQEVLDIGQLIHFDDHSSFFYSNILMLVNPLG